MNYTTKQYLINNIDIDVFNANLKNLIENKEYSYHIKAIIKYIKDNDSNLYKNIMETMKNITVFYKFNLNNDYYFMVILKSMFIAVSESKECAHDFNIDDIKINGKMILNNGKEFGYWFKCPECDKIYIDPYT